MRHALLVPVLLVLSACVSHKERTPDKTYKAYDQTWKYYAIKTRRKYPGLFSSHGLMGMRNTYRVEHYLVSASGESIPLHQRIYALQKNGTYKKIQCCKFFRESAEVYNFGNRIVLVLNNARKYITDCFIYPAGKPNNEFEKDPGKRIFGVTVFGEFNPKDKIFRVRSFDASAYKASAYWAYERKKGYQRARLPMKLTYQFLYSKRKPFLCNDPRAN